MADYNKDIETAKKELQKLQDEIAKAKEDAKKPLRSIELAINNDKLEKEKLEKEIVSKKAELSIVEGEIDQLKVDRDNLEGYKKKAEEELGEVKSGLSADIAKLTEKKKKETEKYQISIEELSNDVRVLTERKNGLQNEVIEAEKTKVSLLEEGNQAKLKLQSDIEVVENNLNSLNLQLKQQNAIFDETAGKIEDMNEQLEKKAKLETKIKELEGKVEKSSTRLSEIGEEIVSKNTEKAEVEQEIVKAKAELEEIKAEMSTYVKRRMDLKTIEDNLAKKEKYIRNKYEEAGIEFTL